MNGREKGAIKIAFVLIGIGALIFCGALASSGFNPLKLSRGVSGYEQRSAQFVGPFSRVRIEDVDANICILPTKEAQCIVYYDETDRSGYHLSIEDDALVIVRERSWLDSFGIIMSAPKLNVYLPEAEYDAVDVRVVSGSIQVEGLNTKEMDLATTSGKIQLSYANVTGEAALKTISGGIKMEAFRAGSLNAKTTSGGIRLDDVDAEELELHTTSGSIKGELMSGKEFEASSVSGRISVPESKPGAGICSASTTSGSISISVAK